MKKYIPSPGLFFAAAALLVVSGIFSAYELAYRTASFALLLKLGDYLFLLAGTLLVILSFKAKTSGILQAILVSFGIWIAVTFSVYYFILQ